MLEREAGVPLLTKAGRGVRLTDAGRVLVEHAEALLDRAARAEADLAAAAGTVAGRARIAGFESVALRLALPAMERLAATAPRLRCEFVEAEPEQALPALALGDIDLVLGDEWEHQPVRLPTGVQRLDLLRDPVRVVAPPGRPPAPFADLAGEAWVAGDAGLGWDEMIGRICRELGGFDPDVRHRTYGVALAVALVAAGRGVTLLPDLALARYDGVAVHPIAERSVTRTIFAATRTADAARPSIQALLAEIQAASAGAAAASS
jgi:DNA-binding transcriptional LysR family regulator